MSKDKEASDWKILADQWTTDEKSRQNKAGEQSFRDTDDFLKSIIDNFPLYSAIQSALPAIL